MKTMMGDGHETQDLGVQKHWKDVAGEDILGLEFAKKQRKAMVLWVGLEFIGNKVVQKVVF